MSQLDDFEFIDSIIGKTFTVLDFTTLYRIVKREKHRVQIATLGDGFVTYREVQAVANSFRDGMWVLTESPIDLLLKVL